MSDSPEQQPLPWFAESGQCTPERLALMQAAAKEAVGADVELRLTPLEAQPGEEFDSSIIRDHVNLIEHPEEASSIWKGLLHPKTRVVPGCVAYLLEAGTKESLSRYYDELHELESQPSKRDGKKR